MKRPWRKLWMCVAVLGLSLPASPAGAQDAWWNYSWPYRRVLAVTDVPKTGLPGDEIGVVTMFTGGSLLSDGQDIRVVTATGEPVAHRVLMVGPGDTVRVAFALKPPATKYGVYFGNEKAPKPTSTLEIKRGVLQETWAYTGGGVASLQHALKVYEKTGELIGRDFRPQIFQGYNPFGPQDRICSIYTGYLVCPYEGEYAFALSSKDASFLLADGKEVVDNGGLHPPQHDISKTGKITLTKGLHELKVYHINADGDPILTVAWREPGGKRIWTIPPEAFAPIRVATAGMMERYAKSVQADFIPTFAGETYMAGRYFQRYTFELLTGGRTVGKPEVQWEFGDGQTASESKVEHVYLRPGPYKVTMTAKVGGEKIVRANTLYVSRPWDQVTQGKLDPLPDHARIVSKYDFSAAGDQDIALAVGLLERANMPEAILKAGDVLVKRDSAAGEVLTAVMPVYSETLAEKTQDPRRAVAALVKAAQMAGKDPAAAALMTVLGGEMALRGGDLDKALELFQAALKKYAAVTTGETIRDARIGVGDVWSARGDYAKALEAYRAVQAVEGDAGKQAIRKGDLARQVEAYTRAGEYGDAADSLNEWEREFPIDKLEGYSTLLRARLLRARKQYAQAAELAERLVRVNPRSNYAPELLMLASDAYLALKKDAAAADCLDRIVKNYPESPLAAEVKKKQAVPASGKGL